jgi:Zn-dependent protease with chaperone function
MPPVSRVLLSLMLCLFALGSGTAAAQDRSAQPEERRADLYLWLNGQEQAYIGLRSDAPLPDTGTLRHLMEHALGGPIRLIAPGFLRLPDGNWVLTADISPALQGRDGLLRGRLDPTPLLPLLQRQGIHWLTVEVTSQDIPYFSISGAQRMPSRDRRLAYGYQYFETDAPSPGPVTFTYGYAPKDVLVRVIPLIGVLLLPVGVTLWVRRRALQTEAWVDPAMVWFGYGRFLQWLSLAPWLVWIAALIASSADGLCHFVLAGTWLAHSGLIAVFWYLPSPVVVWCYALSRPVFSHVRGLDYTRRDLIRQAAWGQARFLPLLCLVMAVNELQNDPRLSSVWLAAALAALIVATQGAARAMGTVPRALTVGDLRDRVFGLAAQAGVRVQQVYVLPAGKGRMVNAFASTGNIVMLTDLLLERLSRREVDAVIAHELTHLRRRHPVALLLLVLPQIVFGILLSTVIGGLTSHVLGGVLYAVGVLLGLLLMYFFSRRFEYAADAGALALTDDPRACITGLTKISRLNQMPLEWGRHQTRWLTHPTTLRRVEAIARRGGVPAEELQALLSEEALTAGGDQYLLPSGMGDGAVFTTRAKGACRQRLAWLLIAVMTLTPALTAVLTQDAHLSGEAVLAAYTLGFLVTALLCRVLADRLHQRWYRTLERRFRDNLELSDSVLARDGEFVTLAPASAPRLYEGFFDWDIGLLSLEDGQMRFVGEQSRFTLAAEQVVTIEARADTPGFGMWSRVYVTWRAGGQEHAIPHTFNLRPVADGGQKHSQEEASTLTERLQSWQKVDGGHENDPSDTTPPTEDSVTSLTPQAGASPRLFVWSLLFQGSIALCVSDLFHLPFDWDHGGGTWYVLLVTCLMTLSTFLPYWRRPLRGK